MDLSQIIVGGMAGATAVASLVAIAQAFGLPDSWNVRASYVAGQLVSGYYYLAQPGPPFVSVAWVGQIIITGITLAWAGSGQATHLANGKQRQKVRSAIKAVTGKLDTSLLPPTNLPRLNIKRERVMSPDGSEGIAKSVEGPADQVIAEARATTAANRANPKTSIPGLDGYVPRDKGDDGA